MQGGKTELHEFHGLILSHFCDSSPKIGIIPTTFTGEHVKWIEISLEPMTDDEGIDMYEIGDFDLKKKTITNHLLGTLTLLPSLSYFKYLLLESQKP